MWSTETLKKMDPYDFELLIGDLFESMGYSTKVTPRSRDFGVDILIKLEHFGLSHSWIVQAKKYNGGVGVREIREYGSLRVRDNVDGVIIVTTGYFTKEAIEEANRYNVKLINGDILAGMLNRYLEKPVPETGITKVEEGDLLLLENEEIVLREPVIISGKNYELVLSNRHIFLKEISFLSKRATLKHKIPVSKLIGVKKEKKNILLFFGGENIKLCPVKGDEIIIDMVEQIRSTVPGREKLKKHSRISDTDLILTNKRLSILENGNIRQIPVKRISGVEIKNGWISRNSKLLLYLSGKKVEIEELAVDDSQSWKSEIENAVRSF